MAVQACCKQKFQKKWYEIEDAIAGVADGTYDATLDVWTGFHDSYITQYGRDMQEIGIIYTDARTGLVVPKYTYDDGITTISDLATTAVAGKEITGIDPGANLMDVVANQIMPDYGLSDYTLTEGTGETMAQAVGDAISNNEEIIATLWQPHSLFGNYELVMLEEDSTSHFTVSDIKMFGRTGLSTDYPELVTFMENMQFKNNEIGALLSHIGVSDLSEPAAAAEWKAQNEDIWINWLAN